MDVITRDPYVDEESITEHGVTKVSMDELLGTADFVSAHVPLIEETEDMFDKSTFKPMKRSAYFVNVSRGGLVVEDDLAWAIEMNRRTASTVIIPSSRVHYWSTTRKS